MSNHSDNDKSKSDAKSKNRLSFIKFNVLMIGGVILIAILERIITKPIAPIIRSKFILKNVLPLIYFAIFSFFFGSLFLVGDSKMKGFIGEYISSDTLNLGIVASYTGVIAIILAQLIKSIVQKLLDVKIVSNPIHDIVGFVIGRVILLFVVEKISN